MTSDQTASGWWSTQRHIGSPGTARPALETGGEAARSAATRRIRLVIVDPFPHPRTSLSTGRFAVRQSAPGPVAGRSTGR